MFKKKDLNTSPSFYSNNKHQTKQLKFKGQPYTNFPVPVERYFYEQNQGQKYKNERFDYAKSKKLQSADCKYRNPGLVNVGRKINIDKYEQENIYGQAQGIRKLGMSYRRKLQQKFNNSFKYNVYNSRLVKTKNSSLPVQKQLKSWYQQRNQALEDLHIEYIKKIQKQLNENLYGKQDRENLLNRLNKQWEQELGKKLKKCFQP